MPRSHTKAKKRQKRHRRRLEHRWVDATPHDDRPWICRLSHSRIRSALDPTYRQETTDD